MKRIYLDQNKWVDLAATVKGLKKGERYEPALLLLRAGIAAGTISLPLSSAHYMETHVRRHWESRRDLAMTMVDLSRMHAIAPIQAVIPPELDRAIEAFFGSAANPRPLKPFGVGAAHALGHPIPPYRLPDRLANLIPNRWNIERSVNERREVVLLAGMPPEAEAELEGFDPLAHLKPAEEYARHKEALRKKRIDAGWNKGERAERVAKAQAFTDHLEPINEAFARARVSADRLMNLGRTGMTRFLQAVPTMFASSELERLRHSASQKPWERQDLTDITALAVASVYCDIVVTERVWVDVAKRARFDSKFNTIFLRRLDDLPQYLV